MCQRVWGSIGRVYSPFELCGWRLDFTESVDSLCIYRRCRRLNDLEECVSKHLVPCGKVKIEPLYPVFYPEHLTSYVMVKLPLSLVLSRGESVRLDLAVGFDVGVTVGNSIVDVFPSVASSKYALYGPPSRGVITRVLHAELWRGASGGCCKARLSVTIVNAYREAVSIRRIVFPAGRFQLEIDNDGRPVYPHVKVSVTSPYTALVSLSDGSGGVYMRRGSGKVFVMSYGL